MAIALGEVGEDEVSLDEPRTQYSLDSWRILQLRLMPEVVIPEQDCSVYDGFVWAGKAGDQERFERLQ